MAPALCRNRIDASLIAIGQPGNEKKAAGMILAAFFYKIYPHLCIVLWERRAACSGGDVIAAEPLRRTEY